MNLIEKLNEHKEAIEVLRSTEKQGSYEFNFLGHHLLGFQKAIDIVKQHQCTWLDSQPPFKVGDIVVCGEVYDFDLTEGKRYKVLDVDGAQIEIEDDSGLRWWFSDNEVVFTLYEDN